jgi:hypothetical protein
VVRKINYAQQRLHINEPQLPATQVISNNNPGIRLNGTREKYQEKLGGK